MSLKSILGWALKKRMHQIDLFMKYPHEVQEELLFKLVDKGKETEWGKRHSFNSVSKISDFQKTSNTIEYESLEPFIARIMDGEKNLLWPGEIKWFAKSSGTTNAKSKFIPVTKEALEDCHYKGGKDLLAIHYHHYPTSKLYMGKSLIIGGSSEVIPSKHDPESYAGDLSAILIKNLPRWVELRRTPHMEIALMDEWEEKIEKMASVTMNQNVTTMAGVPSWTLVLLKRIMELKGVGTISEVWPNLKLYMHGGVSFKPYVDQFKSIMPEDLNYVETYNASEGFFGIQFSPSDDDLLLMLDYGIFYEFIPAEEYGTENPNYLTLKDVEVGQQYVIVTTTNGGLWRYVPGDTIEFTSAMPYRFRITGRTKHFINAFGEELIVDNAERALETACQRTHAQLSEYTAAPVFMSKKATGGHEWLIEFTKEPTELSYFIEAFDNALKNLNSDYEAKRHKNLTLQKPLVRMMPEGTFYNWMKSRGKLGGQNKVPRLCNTREYVDNILNFVRTENTMAG